MKRWLKSLTLAGCLGGIATVVTSPDLLAILPAKYVPLAGTISGVLVALGIRRRLPHG